MAGAGTRITVEFDDADVRRALRRLIAAGEAIDQPGGVLDTIGASLEASVAHRFETETGPDGRPWKQSRRAREEGGQTLSDSGKLRASITRRLGPGEVSVGTNVAYAAVHQFGATIRPRNAKALAFPGPDGTIIFSKRVDIPKRAFLGISTGDRSMIRETIYDRLRRAVQG